MVMKVCKVCGKEFDAKGRTVCCSDECKAINRKASKDAYEAKRRGTRKEYMREYREANREHLREYHTKWSEANREHLREYLRKWFEANSKSWNEYMRNWRIAKGNSMYSYYHGNYIRRHARTLARVQAMNEHLLAKGFAPQYRVAKASGGLGIEHTLNAEEEYVQSHDSIEDIFHVL